MRLIDTAQADEWYDEAAAADGLRASGVERRDVTVVTKLHPKNHGATTARRLIDESAQRFGGLCRRLPAALPDVLGRALWRGLA